MQLDDIVRTRRSYRALDDAEVSNEMIFELATCASLSPSCYNKQPWRFIFVRNKDNLRRLHKSLSKGNEWAKGAPMIIAVVSKKEFDCVVKEREYYLFDTGMSTAFMILKGVDMGLVMHPLAGFDEEKAKKTLKIPSDMKLITLLVCGKHSSSPGSVLDDHLLEMENERPKRMHFDEFSFIDEYKNVVSS